MTHAHDRLRRGAGMLLALSGVLLIFICLPVELVVMVLGAALFAIGVMLLRL